MRKILVAIIIFLILYIGATYLLNVFLPEKIDTAVKKFTQDYLDKKIKISQINISILQGIYLENVKILEKDNKTPYLSVKTIRLVPFYPSLLKEKKLLLSVNMDGVKFSLKRNADNTFNLPQMPVETPKIKVVKETGQKEEKQSEKNDFFLIKSISIKRLNLGFNDETVNFSKKFDDIYIQANLKTPQKIRIKIKWQEKIDANADYNLATSELNALVSLNKIQLKEFTPYLKQQTNIQDGYLDNATIGIQGKENYLLQINAKASNIAVAKESSQIKTDVVFKGKASLAQKKLSYSLTGQVSNANIKSEPYLDSVEIKNASFTLNEKKLQLYDIDAVFFKPQDKKVASEAKINLRAKLDFDFEKSEAYLEAATESSVNNLLNTLKNAKINTFSFLNGFEYKENGNISLNLNAKSNLKDKSFDYYIDYRVKGAKFNNLENIWLKGIIKNDFFSVEDGSLNYKSIPLKLAATVENFSKPHITLGIKSELANILLKADYAKNIFTISSLLVKTKKTQVSSSGTFNTKESTLRLEGQSYIDLKEILSLLNTYKIKTPLADKLNPEGMMNAKFIISGPLEPAKWQVKLAGVSEKMNIYNLEATDLKIELYRDKDLLIISPVTADVADGKAELRAKIDFKNNKITINTLLDDISLESLRKQLNLKSKNLSGILSLDLDFTNDSLSKWDKLDGSGKVSIKEGNIWEINFLKGLGEFLFISEFEEIKFEEGSSDLLLKGENVVFDNIELKSYQMTLKGKGRISLKGDLNFILVSEFNSDLVAASGGLKKLLTTVLGQTALTIDLQGTIKKPTYKVQPAVLSNLEGFKKILDGILK